MKLKGMTTQYDGGIEWFVTDQHDKAKRIAQRFVGRKASVEYRRTKTRSLVKIYH